MYIFIESGRLGNQIFQINYLVKIAKEERIILIGFDDFNNLFYSTKNIRFVKNKSLIYKISQFNRDLIDIFFKNIRIFKFGVELEETGLKFNSGLFNSIKYISQSYFQSEIYMNLNTINLFKFKDIFLDVAKAYIKSFKNNENLYFVHIRRGDYLTYPSKDFPAYISTEWYKQNMDKLKLINPKILFLIFSDDINYVKNDLKNTRDCIFIDNNNALLDFTIMSQCNGAILSASSFSWMAAYLIHKKNNNAILIAPKYWVGHRRKIWHPKFIQTSFFKYAEVN